MHYFLATLLLCQIYSTVAWAQNFPEIEMLHVWRTESEQFALEAFRDPAKSDNIKWREYADADNFFGLKQEFYRRIAIKKPPNVVNWSLGLDIHKLIDSELLEAIPDQDSYFFNNLKPDVYEVVARKDGMISSIPLGIHTHNIILQNTSLLKELGVDEVISFDQLLEFGPQLKEMNINLFSVSDEIWQLRALAVTVFSSVMTKSEYHQAMTEKLKMDGPFLEKLTEVFEIILAMKKFSNNDFKNKKWERVVHDVYTGDALFAVLGDYVVPQVPEEKRDDITCSMFPSYNFILWGADTLVFPKVDSRAMSKGRNSLIEILKVKEFRRNYNFRKGSTPVFLYELDNHIHPCLKSIANLWQSDVDKTFTGGWISNQRYDILGLLSQILWHNPNTDPKLFAKRAIPILNSVGQ